MLTQNVFAEFWNSVCDIYNKPHPQHATIQALYTVFNDLGYDLPMLTQALTIHLKQSEFMPKPVDLRNCLEGSVEENGLRAFRHIYGFRNYTVLYSFRCDDPVLYFALEYVGGWHRFNAGMSNDFENNDGRYMRKDFLSAFKAAQAYVDRIPAGALDTSKFNFAGTHELARDFNFYRVIHSHFATTPRFCITNGVRQLLAQKATQVLTTGDIVPATAALMPLQNGDAALPEFEIFEYAKHADQTTL